MSQLSRYRFAGGTAVVTGAASGIGEQLAYGLARRGSGLVLIDRDADRLAAVAGKVGGVRVETFVADLADVGALDGLVARVLAGNPRITLLVNNAGVALGGTFDQVRADEFDWVMDVNFRAPVALTRLFLPTLRQSPGSHVVNVSSLFGLIGPPGQTAYSASKFALRGFTESLRHELADRGVGVTCAHPGGIRTRIAETARVASGVSETEAAQGKGNFAKLLTYPADKAAERIMAGVAKRKGRVLIAWTAIAPDLIARLFPTSYLTVLNRFSPAAARNAAQRNTTSTGD
ncbi:MULTISPECIES: SDR family NAD(P)-dependent oxidoreductase [Saccharothrix]|uniref:SDR family NAD(P)-dependent oxidoreductase n=1 Tax=Saccharothrix TaxID=2071 RepID=UPI000939BC3A|nr:SDR family NAD(P)-dependent oxidoreductase [Saccharothrix sp. CB00851]OKI29888.1 acetoin dehydrogenase [Saccharothrix sp. CB00851]